MHASASPEAAGQTADTQFSLEVTPKVDKGYLRRTLIGGTAEVVQGVGHQVLKTLEAADDMLGRFRLDLGRPCVETTLKVPNLESVRGEVAGVLRQFMESTGFSDLRVNLQTAAAGQDSVLARLDVRGLPPRGPDMV